MTVIIFCAKWISLYSLWTKVSSKSKIHNFFFFGIFSKKSNVTLGKFLFIGTKSSKYEIHVSLYNLKSCISSAFDNAFISSLFSCKKVLIFLELFFTGWNDEYFLNSFLLVCFFLLEFVFSVDKFFIISSKLSLYFSKFLVETFLLGIIIFSELSWCFHYSIWWINRCKIYYFFI